MLIKNKSLLPKVENQRSRVLWLIKISKNRIMKYWELLCLEKVYGMLKFILYPIQQQRPKEKDRASTSFFL